MVDKQLLNYLENFLSIERKERFRQVLAERTKFITVAIEDVFQLHNTSAVIRSCEVFGVQNAHVIENRYGKRLDKNIAMGAQQWVDVQRHENTKSCISHMRKDGYRIVATTPHDGFCLLEDFEVLEKTALFFGTENDGLSEDVMREADGFLKIPMVGFTESLNISVSAAIILQNLTIKLKQQNLPWQLSDTEKLEKRLDWTKKSIKSIDYILARYYSEK